MSAVDSTAQGGILTGSYDGILRLWNGALRILCALLVAHPVTVTSCAQLDLHFSALQQRSVVLSALLLLVMV